jgi:hypothetical protein
MEGLRTGPAEVRSRSAVPKTTPTPIVRWTSSTEKHLERGRAHLAKLDAHSKAASVGAAFGACQDGLRDALEARRLSERLASRAEALAAGAELGVERVLRELHEALPRAGHVADAAFPRGLAMALAPRGAAQHAEGMRILGVVAAAPGCDDAVRAVASRLDAALSLLGVRLACLAEAERAWIAAVTIEHERRRAWREQWRANHGALTALQPAKPERIDRYFEPRAKRKKRR